MPTVELSSEWGIEAAEGLKALIAPHLDAGDEVVLVAADAGRVHSATLQVLAAFIATRRAGGRATRIEPCADAVRAAAVSLGLASALGLS